MIDSSFWRERRVFVTGHTGFKGAWLSLMLERLCARVTGYGLAPATEPSLYDLARAGENLCDVRGDVCDAAMLDGALRAADPDIVIHLASRPPRDGATPSALAVEMLKKTGGADVLEAALHAPSVQSAIFVSSEAAYVSLDWSELAAEADAHVVSLHCPDPIGGGDFAADRGATPVHFDKREPIHVLDALYGVLLLAQHAAQLGEGMARAWSFSRETHASRLEALGFAPLLDAAEAQQWTQDWRDALESGRNMRAFTLDQIDAYLGQRVRLTSPFAALRDEEPPLRRAVGA
ncbi:MAG: NAD-dependent epimerase/dehydratase family protein [Methylobacteriaceae bacterium]|nr:NAD-dependent epimerase/dehydratase family protein [Methylobacteriaceae bacterium]